MSNPIVARYKIPVFIAVVVSLGIIALSGVADGLTALLALVGSILAIFMLDLEYVLDSYVLNTNSPAAQELKNTYKKGGIFSIVEYFNNKEESFTDLPIRSVLFQVLLTVFGYYLVLTNAHLFALGLVLSMLAQLIYTQIMDIAKGGSLQKWFWIYNGEVSVNGQKQYLGIMIILFIALFWFVI